MFVKQYFPQKSDDISDSSISGRKLRYSFFYWYIGLTIETQNLTRIEYIAIFEAEISIGDVFAYTPFRYYKYRLNLTCIVLTKELPPQPLLGPKNFGAVKLNCFFL